MNAAEFVRHAALGLASGRYASEQSALPPQYTDLLTPKRDQLIREGRGDELNELVKSALNFRESLLEETGRTAATDSETSPS